MKTFNLPKYAYSNITGAIIKFLGENDGIIISSRNNALKPGTRRNDFHNYYDERYWIHLPYDEVNRLYHGQVVIFIDELATLYKGFFNYYTKKIYNPILEDEIEPLNGYKIEPVLEASLTDKVLKDQEKFIKSF